MQDIQLGMENANIPSMYSLLVRYPSLESFLALTTMFTLGGYPHCSAVQKESHSYFHQYIMCFPHCITWFFLALLDLSFMVYPYLCFTTFILSLASPFIGLVSQLLVIGSITSLGFPFILSNDLLLGLLLLETVALQLFPCFRCLCLFSTFYIIPPKTNLGDKLLASLNQPPADFALADDASMADDSLPLFDFTVGPMPSLVAFKKHPATSLYRLFPYQEILKSYTMGVFNFLTWDSDRDICLGNKLEHYLVQACGFHMSKLIKWLSDFCPN